MGGSFDEAQGGWCPGRAQGEVEFDRLVAVHHGVGRAVKGESGWRVALDVADRRGQPPFLRSLLARFGKQLVPFEFIRRAAIGLGHPPREQVDHTIHVDAGTDVVRHAGIGTLRFETRIAGGVGNHQGEVTAGRTADHANALRIDAEFRSVDPQPAHRVLAVVQVERPALARSERVIDAHTKVAGLRQGGAGDELAPRPLVAAGPAAAVDDHHRRGAGAGGTLRRLIEVEFFLPPFRQEGKIAAHAHTGRRIRK